LNCYSTNSGLLTKTEEANGIRSMCSILTIRQSAGIPWC
jgi:hypothetical protein